MKQTELENIMLESASLLEMAWASNGDDAVRDVARILKRAALGNIDRASVEDELSVLRAALAGRPPSGSPEAS